jgi:hypothetical protein
MLLVLPIGVSTLCAVGTAHGKDASRSTGP